MSDKIRIIGRKRTKNDIIFEQEKELASLREQLKDYEIKWKIVHESNRLLSENNSLQEQLKQKEDEIVRLKEAIELYKESLGIK